VGSDRERRPVLEPDMGLVLGCRLGAPLEGVVAVWPGGEVSRSAAGRFTYSLTQQVGRCAALVSASYRFVDERLAAVELRPSSGGPGRAPGGIERHVHKLLADEIAGLLAVAPTLQDEGFVEYARGELCVTIDALDAVIRFEEAL
jgi:hypothetical protein